MRPSLVLAILTACGGPGKDSVSDGPNGTGASTAELVEGGVVTCSDPGLRSAGHYVQKQAPVQPIDAAYLAGGGLVVEDLDGDGLLDLLLPSEETTQLWFGAGGGSFDEGDASVLGGAELSMGVGGSAADYDADGDLDLLVTRWEQPDVLLRNDGGSFTDVTASAGLGSRSLKSQSASWADIDADGDLDLFIGTYGEWTVVDVNEDVPDCDDHIADPSELWRNDGDGTFTDVSDLLPQQVHDGYVFASGFYDLDDDGLPELFTAHDDGQCASSALLDNLDGSTFVVDEGSKFHADAHDMGMAVGDLNGDELPDFLLTSWKTAAYLQSTESAGGASGVMWIDYTDAKGLQVKTGEGTAQQVYGWGAELADVDNDADLDAKMVFGFWSTYDGAGDPMKQSDGLWIQGDDGAFSNQAPAPEWQVNDNRISRGVVFADLNEDGWLDLVKRQLDGPTLMYLSQCGAEAWLRVRLEAPAPNTRGVGAKVRVTAGGASQVRWIQSGSSGLYSGSPLEAHFGLGGAEEIERLEVLWPDGQVSTFEGVAPRQLVTVRRGA